MRQIPVNSFHERLSSVNSTQFPSVSGIGPIRKKRIIEIWSNTVWWMRQVPSNLLLLRSTTLSSLRFSSHSGIRPVKKRDLETFWGRSVHGSYTHQWVGCRQAKVSSIEYNSRVAQEFDLSKKWFLRNLRATCRTDHTLTREFVAFKAKCRHIDTITQWNWDLSCQKKNLWKIRGKSVHGYYTCLRVCWRRDQATQA